MTQELESLIMFLAVLVRDRPSLVSWAQSRRTPAASQSVWRRQSDSRTTVRVCARVSESGKHSQWQWELARAPTVRTPAADQSAGRVEEIHRERAAKIGVRSATISGSSMIHNGDTGASARSISALSGAGGALCRAGYAVAARTS